MSGAPADVEGGVVVSVQVIITLRGAAVARGEAAAHWGALGRDNQELTSNLNARVSKDR